jgi:cbb3-type cytochrome oxidase subunit 3
MSLDSISDALTLIQLISVVVFAVVLVWWAFGRRRRAGFEKDAMIPFRED